MKRRGKGEQEQGRRMRWGWTQRREMNRRGKRRRGKQKGEERAERRWREKRKGKR